MKKPVKITLLSLIPALVLTGGVILAMPDKKPAVELKSVSQPQSTEPNVEQPPVEAVQAETEEAAPTQPASTPVAAAPTPDENRAKVKAEIEALAVSRGMNSDLVFAQWNCIDRTVKTNPGYSDYAKVQATDLVSLYLKGRATPDGRTERIQFDGPVTCRVSYY